MSPSPTVRMGWRLPKDAARKLRRRFRLGLAAAAAGLVALAFLALGGVGAYTEPPAMAPAPSTPGLTTQEQAYILESEASLKQLDVVLHEAMNVTSDDLVRRYLKDAQQLLADAVGERDLADRAREVAASESNATLVAESGSSGGWAGPAAAVLGAAAALGTSIAGLITAWTALRRAQSSAL